MNALEMKLIAMKFALARREYLPNDKKFTSTSGAYDIGSIQQQLGQGITIDDRDLTITNTIIEDCDHAANAEPVTQSTESTPEPQVVATPTEPELKSEPASTTSTTTEPPQTTTTTTTEPPIQAHTDGQSFGGRIWQYFKDTTNVQPKP